MDNSVNVGGTRTTRTGITWEHVVMYSVAPTGRVAICATLHAVDSASAGFGELRPWILAESKAEFMITFFFLSESSQLKLRASAK